jgi:hypothetical protein
MEVHFKTYAVSITDQTANSTVDVEIHGMTGATMIQQNATWLCQWTRSANGPPRLSSVRVEDFEEVTSRRQGTWFADCTEAVLADNDSFQEQITKGLNHWLRRVERVHGMQIYARTGLAIGDVSGDGLDDVYVCQPGGLPNRLFVQDPSGAASDRSRWAGVDWLDHTSSALLVDLDDDGDQDLVLATSAGVMLLANDSSGRFHRRGRLEVERSVESLSAADYDNDGDLDLYVCVYRANGYQALDERFVYHDANNGGSNRLFRNESSTSSSWQFVDVTRTTGLDTSNRRWSLAASWEDFDNDGDQDLYVANDYGKNCLYRNDGGQFAEIADQVGVVDSGSGMSACWGDFNRDGWMDLYVGNMFSAAGSRVAAQPKFRPGGEAATRTLYRRFAKGNSLFQNVRGHDFKEVGATAAVEMARWAWSSLLVDIDNDGWEDAVVANGFISAQDTRDL